MQQQNIRLEVLWHGGNCTGMVRPSQRTNPAASVDVSVIENRASRQALSRLTPAVLRIPKTIDAGR